MKEKLIAICVIFVVMVLACGACLDYTVSTWLEFAGKPDTFKYWHGCLCALIPVIGQLTIPAAFITWILMMFIG